MSVSITSSEWRFAVREASLNTTAPSSLPSHIRINRLVSHCPATRAGVAVLLKLKRDTVKRAVQRHAHLFTEDDRGRIASAGWEA